MRGKQGEVFWLNFNPSAGREQQGKRPCLIVSNNEYNKIGKLRLVVPITTSEGKKPLTVAIPDGLEVRGRILCEQVRAVDFVQRGGEVICELPVDVVNQVLQLIHMQF